jgi:peptide/nickel transport system substrate-binding protein
VAYAVDRAGIVHSVLAGYGQVAETFPPRSEWASLLPPKQVNGLYNEITQYNFDMSKAKSELAASSVPKGFSDTVTYPSSGPQTGEALLTISSNLQEIGINLTVS